MSPAEKKVNSTWPSRARGALFASLHPKKLAGWAALVIVTILLVFFGSRTVWRMVRAHVETQPEYQAFADNIEITPPPKWIHTDIKADVIRDAGLPEHLSILDEHLTDKLTQAFALQPWVARVEKVQRSYPAHIRVSLAYRSPVAMVEVRGGLLPIDANAVLLPPDDFSPAEAENYLRLSGVKSNPLGPLGTPWGDPAVEAGAKLAAVLQPVSSNLQLRRIRILNPIGSNTTQNIVLELSTRTGTTFVWGSVPSDERNGEPKATEKLTLLQRLAADHGSLDAVPAAQRDLRRPAATAPLAETPKTERKH